MDLKKNRHQQQRQQPPTQPTQHHYERLKGATKILSDHSIDQEQQPDKQAASILETGNSASTTDLDLDLVNEQHLSINNNMANPAGSNKLLNQQQQTNSILKTNMLYMTNVSEQSNTHASSSSYNLLQSTSSAPFVPTTVIGSVPVSICASQQQQQQTFKSPQILPCDIKSLFECPICFDYAVPPIYQCQNGHLVCQSCSNKITHCPTCRVPITEPSIRNLQLDRLANTFQFPCKYNFNGCQWKSYWFKKREHEDECEFISYSCPCPGTSCKWGGLLQQVMAHLSEHHKSITTLNGEDIVFLATDINLKGAVDWVMIQSCFNHHFLLVLEKQELKNGQQQFFAIVQLIGSQKEAAKFRYKLELSANVGGRLKRLQWEATPRSILDGVQLAISNYDCLVFDSRMAQNFLSPMKKDKNSSNNNNDAQGENLGINVTIEQVL